MIIPYPRFSPTTLSWEKRDKIQLWTKPAELGGFSLENQGWNQVFQTCLHSLKKINKPHTKFLHNIFFKEERFLRFLNSWRLYRAENAGAFKRKGVDASEGSGNRWICPFLSCCLSRSCFKSSRRGGKRAGLIWEELMWNKLSSGVLSRESTAGIKQKFCFPHSFNVVFLFLFLPAG